MKLISIVTPCYNEEGNVRDLCAQIKKVFEGLPQYGYEHICIDNSSSDGTVVVLKEIAAHDKNLKIIVNMRNFGHLRSPYYAMLQARGDAVVFMASDLQDSPALLPEFIQKWEEGSLVVLGQKTESNETKAMFILRSLYYRIVKRLADVELIEHVTGFGLYDRVVIEQFRKIDDPYPYVRGLISELGYPVARITYQQPLRKRGVTKNNFYTLYDLAMLGLTSHSKVPLRLATMLGFAAAFVSLLAGAVYFVYKLMFWDSFSVGIAPLVIGLFVFSSVQLVFLGIVGEYVAAIHTHTLKRPLVIEKERVNFDSMGEP